MDENYFECLVDCCLNLVGFKDGVGDLELMICIYVCLGDCFIYVGGLLIVEIFVLLYFMMGVLIYLLVIFNFVLEFVLEFYVVV